MLGRTKNEPQLTVEDAEFILEVTLALHEALALHRRALEAEVPREELLGSARRIAALDRWVMLELELSDGALQTRIPEPLQPFAALWPLRRVGYGLTALAQDPPDTAAALIREELDALLDEDVAQWLERRLENARSQGRA